MFSIVEKPQELLNELFDCYDDKSRDISIVVGKCIFSNDDDDNNKKPRRTQKKNCGI